MRIVETGNARFFENSEISGSSETRNVVVDEIRVELSIPSIPSDLIVLTIVESPNDIEKLNDQPFNDDVIAIEDIVEEPLS